MRVLTEQEVNNISAAYCPLCFAASALAVAGASSTVLGMVSDDFYFYASGAILFTLSTAVTIQFFLGH